MPLYDNLRRQVESIPAVAAYDPAADYAPLYDASAGVMGKILLKDLRSLDVFSLPIFVSRTVAPSVTAVGAPFRVFRAPWALTVSRIYATADTAPAGNFSFCIMKNSLSLETGSSALSADLTIASGNKLNSYVPATTSFSEMDEFRIHIQTTQSAIRVPWIHIVFYRT